MVYRRLKIRFSKKAERQQQRPKPHRGGGMPAVFKNKFKIQNIDLGFQTIISKATQHCNMQPKDATKRCGVDIVQMTGLSFTTIRHTKVQCRVTGKNDTSIQTRGGFFQDFTLENPKFSRNQSKTRSKKTPI
jgi:hypothetical protein